jgi:hypothetical protein
VTPPDQGGFAVNYTLNKYQPATVQVQVMHNPGDLTTAATTTIDPSPVFAELQPMAPPPKAHKPRPKTPKAPKAAAAPADQSPFPNPGAPAPAGR